MLGLGMCLTDFRQGQGTQGLCILGEHCINWSTSSTDICFKKYLNLQKDVLQSIILENNFLIMLFSKIGHKPFISKIALNSDT